ncbi:MAG: cobalt ECF transporter T component CbiQ [Acidobacteriia bacterium]|nr:cobalt ECF transporter T component CbiQ [Terriglobia bacterium]
MSRHSFLGSTLQAFTRAVSKALLSEHAATQPGLLQQLDPRVRVIGILALVISVILCRRLEAIAALLLIAITLAVASRVSLMSLAKRVFLVILGFTGLIALPALFLTPGEPLFTLRALHLAISVQGMRTAALLVLRVETAATLTTVLVLSTAWTHILKALRSLRLPAEVVTMLAMTHRYVFLLIEAANQMFESRKSRTVGVLSNTEQRSMTARTAGVLLSKSIELSHEVYLAMLSRGFRGEVRLLTDFRLQPRDYVGLTAFIFTSFLAVWIGR